MTIYEFQNILSQYGIFVLAALIFLEYLSLPGFPRGIVLPLTGICARLGIFSFLSGYLTALAVSLFSCCLIYGIGYALPDPLMKFYSKQERHAARFQAVEKYLKKKGKPGQFLCRLHPVFRTFISIPDGILRVNVGKYLLNTVLGNALFLFLSMGFGYVITMIIV